MRRLKFAFIAAAMLFSGTTEATTSIYEESCASKRPRFFQGELNTHLEGMVSVCSVYSGRNAAGVNINFEPVVFTDIYWATSFAVEPNLVKAIERKGYTLLMAAPSQPKLTDMPRGTYRFIKNMNEDLVVSVSGARQNRKASWYGPNNTYPVEIVLTFMRHP